ncbi:LAMI_0H10066g1_1 [Lachancea mirantina]|uniref:LAMI_0H10066g1_1 n=1 Tax=Lachancea mirantina TaxID=1230905 RepID=A0A1G4KGN7_9SACH|nr:LAMI_0H10066g1_1 [Lachancea mirantina]
MADTTVLFRKIVQVFEETNGPAPRKPTKSENQYRIKDTFVSESYDLVKHIYEFRKVMGSLKNEYQSENEMSEQEKDDFDTECRLLLQQYFEKLKFLEKYETKRSATVATGLQGGLFGPWRTESDRKDLFFDTASKHRAGILRSLGLLLSGASTAFSKLQQERLLRKRELDSIDFNAQLYLPTSGVISKIEVPPAIETTQEEVKQYNDTVQMLSTQQIQILEEDHSELLSHKKAELNEVEKLSKTIIGISSLQNEISTHLQSQTQNISSLLDNYDDVEVDVLKGNKQLGKAQRRSGKSAALIMYLSIVFGMLILFLDYIN